MITKELFELITGIFVDPTKKFKPKIKNNILKISVVTEWFTEKDIGEEIDQEEYNEMIEEYGVAWAVCEVKSFNMYELVHKCKVFAEAKGWGTKMAYFNDVCSTVTLFDIYWSPSKKKEYTFEDEDEVEAMFKACQWIINTNNAARDI
jgi:hypothetical protein